MEQFDSRLSNGAKLAADLLAGGTSFMLTSVPSGVVAGTYRFRIDAEQLDGQYSGSGATFTSLNRGLAGTTAAKHYALTTVLHVISDNITRLLTVEETDGSPSVEGVRKLRFPNGSLSVSDTTVTVSPVGGGGDVATDPIWDAKGDLAAGTGADTASKLGVGTDGQVLSADSTQATGLKWNTVTGTGTVTDVAMTVPSDLSVSGSPVTTTGTLAVTRNAQSGNKVLSSPSDGSSGTPDFRALVAADIPAIPESGVTSLTTDLAGKAAASHSHAESDVTSLTTDLGNKASTTHTTPVMVASGGSHAAGHVPDPGASGGTTKYLREDASWAVPPGGSAITIAELDGAPSGAPGTLKFPNGTLTDNGDGSYTFTPASDSSKAPVASPTFTGITTAPEFSASGLTGAVAASRYVGATASGAPVSGTFVLGDWIAAQDGKRWTCTVGGTPGTWAQEPGTGGGSGLYSAYLNYQDQKAQNTGGGSFSSGAWRTRNLNTEVVDTGNHGSVASDQVTLDAGTYQCRITVPAYSVDHHQARLQNVTDVATVLVGTSEYSAVTDNTLTHSTITGRFTIGTSKTFEVQHQCSTTFSAGLGSPANFTTEIYTVAEFWKES